MNALALPCVWFLHPFRPKWTVLVVGLILSIFYSGGKDYQEFGGPKKFSEWVDGLIDTFKPPNKYILAVTPKKIPARNVWFHWPQTWESVPYPAELRDQFGLVLIDQKAPQWYRMEAGGSHFHQQTLNRLPFSDQMLEWCFIALVRGGKLVVVEERRPVIVLIKNGEDVPK